MILESIEGGNLPIILIKRLRQVFRNRGWEINPTEDDFEDDDTLFDRFCLILGDLNTDERDLILNLTEGFLLLSSMNYSALIKNALEEIPIETINSCDEILLLPLTAPKDFGKVKSSTSWLYTCLTEVFPRMSIFNGKFRKGFVDMRELGNDTRRNNTLVLLCDDFIGTGDTAIEALTYYKDNLSSLNDKVYVVTLVTQEKGAEAIIDFGFNVAFAKIVTRGISDSKTLDKDRALEIMKSIELKLSIKPIFSLGYKESEALVSMMRTPNNTFPVFWTQSKIDGTRWASPFERK